MANAHLASDEYLRKNPEFVDLQLSFSRLVEALKFVSSSIPDTAQMSSEVGSLLEILAEEASRIANKHLFE